MRPFFPFLLLPPPYSNFFFFFSFFFLFFLVYLPGPLPSPPCRDSLCLPSPLSMLSPPSFPPSFRLFFYPLVFTRLSLSLSSLLALFSLPSFSSPPPLTFLVVSLTRVCVSFARRDACVREYYSPSNVAHARSSPLRLLSSRVYKSRGKSRDIDIAAHDRGPIRDGHLLYAPLYSHSLLSSFPSSESKKKNKNSTLNTYKTIPPRGNVKKKRNVSKIYSYSSLLVCI